MERLLGWAALGAVLGFVLFAGLFNLTWPRNTSERLLWIAFAIMGAIPVSLLVVIVGSVRMLKQELQELRREVVRLQRMQGVAIDHSPSSTQFRAGFPEDTHR
jgi:hypothetical protein